MTLFLPLRSGSSGNATYIGTRQEGILIDAGASAKSICTELSLAGVEPSAVRGILITHDHNDHIKGLRVLAKRLRVPVWATVETLEGIIDTGNLDPARSLEIMRLLERINALGTTVLVVTHEKDLVNRFDKRVVMLERGRVVSDGFGYYGRKAL